MVSSKMERTTALYTCPHDPMRQAHAWCERDAEVVIGCLKCPRECPGPEHLVDVNKMFEPPEELQKIDPDGELWEHLIGGTV